mgnify:FL=1
MTEPVISVLMQSVVEQVRSEIPELGNRVTYGAPEAVPAAMSVWFDYHLAEYEVGLLDVQLHQAIATIATPRKGAYPHEYRAVTDMQQRVRQAVRLKPYYADEAVLVAIESQPAIGAGYAGVDDALVAARLTFTLETKTEILAIP